MFSQLTIRRTRNGFLIQVTPEKYTPDNMEGFYERVALSPQDLVNQLTDIIQASETTTNILKLPETVAE
jgi:hypothetical protein